MQYNIIKSGERQINDAIAALAVLVNQAIASGWVPLGGISVTSVNVGTDLVFVACQAMTTNV
jgi:hypothetical protein